MGAFLSTEATPVQAVPPVQAAATDAAMPPEAPAVPEIELRVHLNNIPRHAQVSDIKAHLRQRNVTFQKVVKRAGQPTALVLCRDKEQQQALQAAVDGTQYRNRTLSAQTSTAKRPPRREPPSAPVAKRAKANDIPSDLPPVEQIALKVAPYMHKPYPEQLNLKHDAMLNILTDLDLKLSKAGVPWAQTGQARVYNVEAPLRSPVLDGYRNKCEFTVGRSPEGEDKILGFQLGRFVEGILSVERPTQVPHVPESFKRLARVVEAYLKKSSLKGFDRSNNSGNFRQLMVRKTTHEEHMSVLLMSSQGLSEDQFEAEIAAMRAFFAAEQKEQPDILQHLMVQVDNSASGLTAPERPIYQILGEQQMLETMNGLTFRVSPDAFFQVNIPAAEELYRLVGDWAGLSDVAQRECALLDICSGTGTIGQLYANRVRRVIGFELVESAVEDAKHNAELNGLTNCSYFAGRAEKTMPEVAARVQEERVVGIVDPPRCGLHGDVLRAIRSCQPLEELVYVACNFKASHTNIVDLCRKTSKRWQGDPFQLVRVRAVDLFPHTPHMEVVLLLLRGAALERWQARQALE